MNLNMMDTEDLCLTKLLIVAGGIGAVLAQSVSATIQPSPKPIDEPTHQRKT